MEYFLIYLILIADNVRAGFGALLILGFAGILVAGSWLLVDIQYKKPITRLHKAGCGASVLFLFFCITSLIFLPSTQQLLLIAAGGKTLVFANNDEHLKQLPGQSSELVYEFLQKQLNKYKKEPK